jgi:TetR/AcrR family transcriptional regulator
MNGTSIRDQLLQSALTLFASRGYDAVGVQELCTTTGVTKPTLYHYFGSKLGVLETLAHEYGDPILAEIHQASIYAGDLPFTLERIACTMVSVARREPQFYRLILASYFAPADSEAHHVVAPILQNLHTYIQNVFIQAVVQHGNTRGRHQAYALSFLCIIHSLIGFELSKTPDLPALTLPQIQQMIHWYQHGIYS